MSFDTIYRDGVQRIWEEDAESQRGFLDAIASARNMKSIDFKAINAFFVPNDAYILKYFDDTITFSEYGFYEGDYCFWNNCLLMPIYDVADKVVSVAGFNPFRYLESKEKDDRSINYYIYAPSQVFKKGSFMFYLEGCYKRALDDQYIIITDGVFDTIALQLAGFNAGALMSSSVTQEIATLLRFIKHVLIASDNDEAGLKLVEKIRAVHPFVTVIRQKRTKDIDDLLKSEYRDKAISELKMAINSVSFSYSLNV